MCGRYVSPDTDTIKNWWKNPLQTTAEFPFHFNVAPTLQVPLIQAIPERGNTLGLARWGLVPHWWKETGLPTFSFNARSEEAHQKPMWRHALQHSRCIMPAAGWYEWKTEPVVDTRTGEVKTGKQPYFLFKTGEPVISIAGLVSSWMSEDGPLLTCALLTKAAPPELLQVHDRMPVILDRADCEQWLNTDTSPDTVQALIRQSDTAFAFYPVSKAVNNARNNRAELMQPEAGYPAPG